MAVSCGDCSWTAAKLDDDADPDPHVASRVTKEWRVESCGEVVDLHCANGQTLAQIYVDATSQSHRKVS